VSTICHCIATILSCRVEAHGAAAVDMTQQGGGTSQHRHAVVSFQHMVHSPEFWGADGVSSPAWVTAELRCAADFRSASQPELVESLRIGIDVEVSQAAGLQTACPTMSEHGPECPSQDLLPSTLTSGESCCASER
jgi:hypothetical protein